MNLTKRINFQFACLLAFFGGLFLIVSCNSDDEVVLSGIDLTHITYDPETYVIDYPKGFSPMEIPADNPMTIDGRELGRYLFYDTVLSADSSMACASCHLPQGSFTDNLAVSKGIDGIAGRRSSMSLLNIGFATNGLFWDGRVLTLEEQALMPVEDEIELNNDWPTVMERLKSSEQYRSMFRKAFGISNSEEMSKTLAAKAIAQFERSLISSGESLYDRIEDTEGENAGVLYETEELLGKYMFFDGNPLGLPEAECEHCHEPINFTNNGFVNNGIEDAPDFDSYPDIGYNIVTGADLDIGRFKTPTLRNIANSAPYMHDGRFETLEEVMDHYNSGGHVSHGRDALIKNIGLTEDQKQHIIAFLKTLSDPVFMENPAHASPF